LLISFFSCSLGNSYSKYPYYCGCGCGICNFVVTLNEKNEAEVTNPNDFSRYLQFYG